MSSNEPVVIGQSRGLSLADLRRLYTGEARLEVADAAWMNVQASSESIERIVQQNAPVYGVNTGFGVLAQMRIPDDKLADLQKNLVMSHSVGVGPIIDPRITRLIIALKIASLAQGHSGVRRRVVETLLLFLDRDICPCIPAKGSVGASGDLAPLAHLAAAMIGIGDVLHAGERIPALSALKTESIAPLKLAAKEGLALLNGTQVSTGLALAALFEVENLISAAVVAGAMSLDGLKGSVTPFDDRIHRLRKQPGQREIAKVYLRLLDGSEILASHADCDKVQDPYSLRCQPQVMGACLDLIRQAAQSLEIEANAVTDNPLIFADTDEALSGGNFHAEPVAFAADMLALAIAEIGSLSERRIALLVDPNMNNGLPAFLVRNSGVNSGFMIAQVTSAALVSENKSLAHPASVDSIPTSANQEDHVSMATYASRRLLEMAANAANVVAIELLAACQAIDFRLPHRTTPTLQNILKGVRKIVPHYDGDRYFAPDVEQVADQIQRGEYMQHASAVLPSSQAIPTD